MPRGRHSNATAELAAADSLGGLGTLSRPGSLPSAGASRPGWLVYLDPLGPRARAPWPAPADGSEPGRESVPRPPSESAAANSALAFECLPRGISDHHVDDLDHPAARLHGLGIRRREPVAD